MCEELGIGVDIENVSRFSEVKTRSDRFLKTFMTEEEIDYCYSKESPRPHIAARFAGKEAVIKALNGLSMRDVTFRDIEITNDENGVPHVSFKTRRMLNIRVEISLSHSGDYAVAFAIAARGDKR